MIRNLVALKWWILERGLLPGDAGAFGWDSRAGLDRVAPLKEGSVDFSLLNLPFNLVAQRDGVLDNRHRRLPIGWSFRPAFMGHAEPRHFRRLSLAWYSGP